MNLTRRKKYQCLLIAKRNPISENIGFVLVSNENFSNVLVSFLSKSGFESAK